MLAVVSLQTGFAATTTNINNTTSGGINGTLSSSNDGDIIELGEGTYTGNNNTNVTITKNITIQGKAKNKVIIDAQGLSRIFILHGNQNISVTFINITFINGFINGSGTSGSGGAIINNNPESTIILINCTFTNNTAVRANGGAIYTIGNLTIQGSNFINNSAFSQAGAIFCYGNVSSSISDSTFIGNAADYGGALLVAASTNSTINFNLSGSTISDNTATYRGGGVYISGSAGDTNINIDISDSTISNNIADYGGGIYGVLLNGTYIINISDSSISDNIATSDGGGIYATIADEGNITFNIKDSKIKDNVAGNNGGGIFSSTFNNSTGSSTVNVDGSEINGNSAGNNGGALSATTGENSTGDSTINVIDSDIANNTAGNNGDSISATTGDGSTGNSEVNVGGNSTITNNNPNKNDDGIIVSLGEDSTGNSSINLNNVTFIGVATSSSIEVSNVIVGKSTIIRGITKGKNGNILANIQINVIIDGKKYDVITNSAGEWSLTYIPTKVGNIQITVTSNANTTYSGFMNNVYQVINTSKTFNIAKRNIIATITAKENKDGSVTIIANATYEDDNSPASGYQVDFLLDGKIVGTGITNKNGIAKFTIPANKITNGQHTITAMVHGAETVNNANVSIVFARTSPDNETNKTNKTSNNPAATAAMKNTGIPITSILALLSTISLIAIRKKQN